MFSLWNHSSFGTTCSSTQLDYIMLPASLPCCPFTLGSARLMAHLSPHYITLAHSARAYCTLPQQINHIMKIWINLNKWLHIICAMLKTTTKLYSQSSKLLSLTGMGWVWQMWADWSHCFITAVSPRSSGRETLLMVTPTRFHKQKAK